MRFLRSVSLALGLLAAGGCQWIVPDIPSEEVCPCGKAGHHDPGLPCRGLNAETPRR